MKTRKLGRSQLEVAPLALGGNVFGWTADRAASFKVLDAFVDAGLNLIDTADVYTVWIAGNKGGESETIIGDWFKQSGKRDRVVLATKCGMDGSIGEKNLSSAHIKGAVERSLQRLRSDYIDLYQSHIDDEGTPLEETMVAFDELIKEGKVRAIGASNYTAQRLSLALEVSAHHRLARYESLQPHYSLYERIEFEERLAPLCQKEEIGVITFLSLARGFLTGKYRSEADLGQSKRGEGVRNCLNERGFRILSALDELSRECRATPAQLSLAWLMARPGVTAALASATRVEQLHDLIESTRLELSAAHIARLNDASRPESVLHSGGST